jgi:alkanesulfonate monooxygenase SsuD/methylene tetrahydromethanopterin reductase-like flavin-dependent oxidoreductase (luciferase family)
LVRRGLFLPPFGEAADPGFLASLAAEAEAAGWDGVFLWDHLRFPGVDNILDPWIALAAIASATKRIRLGQMVTPLPRRRPWVVARQTAALDLLSRGRMVLGVGLGDPEGGEFAAFGEELDLRVRAEMMEESLELIPQLLSGSQVEHSGIHYQLSRTEFRPAALQRPLPIWVAARWPNRAPVRRAARFQGVFAIQLERPEELLSLRELLAEFGQSSDQFELVIAQPPGTDPGPWREAGASWLLDWFGPLELRRDDLQRTVSAGPG